MTASEERFLRSVARAGDDAKRAHNNLQKLLQRGTPSSVRQAAITLQGKAARIIRLMNLVLR